MPKDDPKSSHDVPWYRYLSEVDKLSKYAHAVADTIKKESVSEMDKYLLAGFFVYEKVPDFCERFKNFGFPQDYIIKVMADTNVVKIDMRSKKLDPDRFIKLGQTIYHYEFPKRK